MDAALQSMGAEPDSWMYKGGKIGAEIAGTAGAGGLLAKGVAAIPGAAAIPRVAQLVEALKTGGFTLGGKAATSLGGRAADLGIRAAGGAAGGALGAGMVAPNEAGMGAMIGGGLPIAAKAVGATAGAIGDAVRYVKRPQETRIANKLAQALQMSPEELALALNQTGPNRLMGLQQTVPQILQNPVTSQLQRTLQTAGVNTLGDAEKIQQSQLRAALDNIAPADLTLQDAANRAGNAVQDYAKPAQAEATKGVNRAFDAVDPFNETAIYLPIDEMKAALAKFLGTGTFGTGSNAASAIQTARNVGTEVLPGVEALAPTAAKKSQSLEQAVRSAGGIRGGSGELRDLGIKQSGTTGMINNKSGQSADLLAEEMHRRGFISDADPSTLFDALRNGAGRKVFASDQVENNAMQRMAESAMGDAPGAEIVSKTVPFQTVQNLRSSIVEAAQQAELKGANKESAALKRMIGEIDSRINNAASGKGIDGEFFPKDIADQYRLALGLHANKKAVFETGPQIGMFRQGADGQTSIQGAEIPRKFFSGNRSQVEDMQAFKRLIGNRSDLADEMKRYAITEAQSTGNTVTGDLTSKFLNWAESRSGANRELFNAQELETIKDVGGQIEKIINAETLGKVKSGSDTAQRLEGLKNLGVLDSKLINMLATKIPVFGSFTGPALDSLRKSATQTRNELMSKLLTDPQYLSEALQPAKEVPASALALALQKKVLPAIARTAPAIAAQ